VAETAASIGKRLPLAGSVTLVRPGRASRARRPQPWNNTPSATLWGSSVLITSALLVVAFRVPPEALSMREVAVVTDRQTESRVNSRFLDLPPLEVFDSQWRFRVPSRPSEAYPPITSTQHFLAEWRRFRVRLTSLAGCQKIAVGQSTLLRQFVNPRLFVVTRFFRCAA